MIEAFPVRLKSYDFSDFTESSRTIRQRTFNGGKTLTADYADSHGSENEDQIREFKHEGLGRLNLGDSFAVNTLYSAIHEI